MVILSIIGRPILIVFSTPSWVAVWFLLTQSGMTSKYTLALSSFVIGLVTDEVIKVLLGFIRRLLGSFEQGQRDPIIKPNS